MMSSRDFISTFSLCSRLVGSSCPIRIRSSTITSGRLERRTNTSIRVFGSGDMLQFNNHKLLLTGWPLYLMNNL
jgi:hypothetical protein